MGMDSEAKLMYGVVLGSHEDGDLPPAVINDDGMLIPELDGICVYTGAYEYPTFVLVDPEGPVKPTWDSEYSVEWGAKVVTIPENQQPSQAFKDLLAKYNLGHLKPGWILGSFYG